MWQSGLTRTVGNCVFLDKRNRGFEAHHLRREDFPGNHLTRSSGYDSIRVIRQREEILLMEMCLRGLKELIANESYRENDTVGSNPTISAKD